jgi:hypothetical protein
MGIAIFAHEKNSTRNQWDIWWIVPAHGVRTLGSKVFPSSRDTSTLTLRLDLSSGPWKAAVGGACPGRLVVVVVVVVMSI